MAVFPSLEWMQAYAGTLAAHPMAGELARDLDGRYRFVVKPAGTLAALHRYDLVVMPSPGYTAEPAQLDLSALLTITADYVRWQALITGDADIVMSYLMRRIKIDGDLGLIRTRLKDAGPLLSCLREVPTEFP